MDDLGLPRRLEEITRETWDQLNLLVDPAEDTPATHAVLDDLRAAYTDLYAESESIARSTAVHRGLVEARRAREEAVHGTAEQRRLSDLVPHAVREKIPPGVRRGVRRVLGRARD